MIFIESDFKSFEDFHDKQWFSDLFDSIDGSEIVDEVEELSAHWWVRSLYLPKGEVLACQPLGIEGLLIVDLEEASNKPIKPTLVPRAAYGQR